MILNDFYGLLKTPPKVCTQGTKHLFEMSSDTILQPHQEIKQKMHTRQLLLQSNTVSKYSNVFSIPPIGQRKNVPCCILGWAKPDRPHSFVLNSISEKNMYVGMYFYITLATLI